MMERHDEIEANVIFNAYNNFCHEYQYGRCPKTSRVIQRNH